MTYADDGNAGGWSNQLGTAFPEGFWEDLPKPAYWRVLIAPMRPKEQTKSGIVLALANQEAQEILNFMGQIVAVGPQAGRHERLGGNGVEPAADFPKKGEYVIYGKYAGQPMLYRGVKLLLLNDDEILGTIPNPETLATSV